MFSDTRTHIVPMSRSLFGYEHQRVPSAPSQGASTHTTLSRGPFCCKLTEHQRFSCENCGLPELRFRTETLKEQR